MENLAFLILVISVLVQVAARGWPRDWYGSRELREGFKRLNIMHQGQPLRQVSISLRVAAFPEHASTVKILIKTADKALYRAKAAGRDRVEVAPVSQEVSITAVAPDQAPEVQVRRRLNG